MEIPKNKLRHPLWQHLFWAISDVIEENEDLLPEELCGYYNLVAKMVDDALQGYEDYIDNFLFQMNLDKKTKKE
ncbi:MAG: hypothetical protein ACFE9S_07590 [Candidatus Hermodarchaeota archaeon]